MIKSENAVLVFVDVQEKLSEHVAHAHTMFKAQRQLLKGIKILGVPLIITEQLPEKLGPTRKEFRDFNPARPIVKSTFSCCGEPAFSKKLRDTGRRQVILAGIETHVCVYQTAMDLLAADYEVTVVTDAVSSRNPANKELALRRMEAEGVKLTGTEMLLFELLGDARSEIFKAILSIIK